MDELQIVDLSNNLFTGSVPYEIFELPKIRYVSITEGCFEGSIPRTVCLATTMTHLILEGLSSGRDCNINNLWDPLGLFAQGSVFTGGLSGGIPGCLFRLENLTTLHLSGNGLDGTLPVATEPKALKDLSLSYNKLTGTIPDTLLQSSYSKFDLSKNKITGTCDNMQQWTRSDTETENLLNLAFNRLSGSIPTNFQGLDFIDMLEGNIFTCPDRESDLPKQDPNYSTYICASDDYDEMLLIWATFLLCAIIMCVTCALFFWAFSSKNIQCGCCGFLQEKAIEWVTNVRKWNNRANAVQPTDGPQLYSFLMFLKLLRDFATKLSLMIMIILSTLFLILKVVGEGGTHTYQYRWMTSAAYLSGTLAASMLIVAVTGIICYAFYSVMQFNCTINTALESGGANVRPTSSSPKTRALSTNTIDSYFVQKDSKGNWKRAYSIIFCGLLMNAIVVLVVNGLYVYIVSWKDLTINAVLGIQVTKSIFDIMWNNVAIRMFMKKIKTTLRIKRLVRLVLAMLLFNNILAPILSTLVTDNNCFSGVFVENNEISTTTTLSYCQKLARVNITDPDFDPITYVAECEITGSLDLETNYLPRFQYNYQCSSSFLANFIPIIVFTSGSVTFIVPMFQMTVSYFLTHRIAPDKLPIVPPSAYFPGVQYLRNPRHYIFSTDMVVAKLLQNITMMLTFGIACPNLALIVGVHVFVMTWYYHVFLGRYLTGKEAAAEGTVFSNNDGGVDSKLSQSGVKDKPQKEGATHNPMMSNPTHNTSEELSCDKAVNNNSNNPLGEVSKDRENSVISIVGEGGKLSQKDKHMRYQEDRNSDDDSYIDDSDMRSTENDNNYSIGCRPQKIQKNKHVDKLLEHDCRDISLAPEVAIWTIIDISAVCTALVLIDISGDTNGLTGALLAAAMPILCIPLLLRVVHRKYYMLMVPAVVSELNLKKSDDKFDENDVEESNWKIDVDKDVEVNEVDGVTVDRDSGVTTFSLPVRRGDRELSQAETDTEARYEDDM